ncbi:MAG: DEAD/DEAH box helicase, partial [bacterium]|nr:DEAD/DEAH box helicase [bacterium]
LEKTKEKSPEKKSKSKAKLGLVLEKKFEWEKKTGFRTRLIPVKKNGLLGAVKGATPAILAKYELSEPPEFLADFHNKLCDLSQNNETNGDFAGILNRFAFKQLTDLVLEMPDDLVFCRSYFDDKKYHPLQREKFKKINVTFKPCPEGDGLSFSLELTSSKGFLLPHCTDYDIVIYNEEEFFIVLKLPGGTICYAVPEEPEKFHDFFQFLEQADIILYSQFKNVLKALKNVESDSLVIHPDPLPFYRLHLRPVPQLTIVREKPRESLSTCVDILFDYKTGIQEYQKKKNAQQFVDYKRDSQFETMCINLLKKDPLLTMMKSYNNRPQRTSEYYFAIRDGNEIEWLIESGTNYLGKGFRIYSEKQKKYIGNTGSTIRVELKSGINWLEFNPSLIDPETGESFDIESIDPQNLTIVDKSGALHLVKSEEIEKLIRLYKYAEPHGDVFRVPSENYILISELYDRRMENLPRVKQSLAIAEKLRTFKKIPEYQLTGNFNGTLRKYQEAGFNWLSFLHEFNLSGCLADDMGLGKTIQTLALLKTLKDKGALKTSLLVVPVSAVPNWLAEIGKFTPGLTAYCHMGTGRDGESEHWRQYDLVITSYATLRNDIAVMKAFSFDYIVLDESQNIKNSASQVSKAVKLVQAAHRLALSGTPLENNSMELWSLFDF